MKKSPIEHGEVKTLAEANRYTELHEGLPTLKPAPYRAKPRTEYTTKYLKFNTITRNCPIHGKSVVVSRTSFSPDTFALMEGLACGHTLLISRVTKGRKFWRWQLIFKETIYAS